MRLEIKEVPWARIGESPAAFVQAGLNAAQLRLYGTRRRKRVRSGIQDLQILKTTDSAFPGFMKDQYTTLAETNDRLLGTVLQADWLYTEKDVDFNERTLRFARSCCRLSRRTRVCRCSRRCMIWPKLCWQKFAAVAEIHLVMPNKHCLLVDLSKFGMDNPNQIFQPIDEPSGYIEALVGR